MPSDPRPGVPRLEPDEPAQPIADPGKLAAAPRAPSCVACRYALA